MTETKEEKRWKALVEYQEKHDILRLQQQLGHKSYRTTMTYLDRVKPLRKLIGNRGVAE